jgi:hypothetical protein
VNVSETLAGPPISDGVLLTHDHVPSRKSQPCGPTPTVDADIAEDDIEPPCAWTAQGTPASAASITMRRSRFIVILRE